MIGRVDESLAEARSAVERDPVSHLSRDNLAMTFVTARRFKEAVQAFRLQVKAAPADPVSQACLGWALGLAGQGS